MNNLTETTNLPLTGDLTTARISSLVVAFIMVAVSIVGLLQTDHIYPSEELIQFFLPNDFINLLIGLPILLGSMWLSRRGKLVGLLLWPGALLYVLYNYIVYLLGMPVGGITLAYLVLVLLSAYITYDLLKKIDHHFVGRLLTGAVPTKFSAWVLVVFGVFFVFRAVGILADARANQGMLSMSEIGLLIADVVLSLIWIAGGILLLRRKPLGYSSGLGLLFLGSVLFIGLILVLLLQPLMTGATFVVLDVIVVFIMGFVCFVPFGLYLRATVLKG